MTLTDLWKKKLLILAALAVWGGLPYHLIQKVDFSKVFTMPTGRIDQLIPLNLESVWIYHSWLLVPLCAVMLLPNVTMLKRYGWGLFAVNLLSFLIFLLFPTEAPRPDIQGLEDPPLLYLLTIQMDKPLNACPSLHASVTLFCAAFALLQINRWKSHWKWSCMVLQAFWAFGILYSTLATRQHVFLDMVAGSTLGVAVSFFALRWPSPSETAPLPSQWGRAF